jgi:glycosyl transferase family 25
MEYVHKVIYINLEHRKDRKAEIEREFAFLPKDKLIRFNAFKHEKGAIGCTMSHIGALELAIKNKFKNVLIVEDDMKWRGFKQGNEILKKLMVKKYDAIVLGGHGVNYDPPTYKLKDCYARTAYLVSNHYFGVLLRNFKEALAGLQKTNDRSIYSGDRYWNRIQNRDNWFIVMPAMVIQRPSYSDIEKKFADYSHNVTRPVHMIAAARVPNVTITS